MKGGKKKENSPRVFQTGRYVCVLEHRFLEYRQAWVRHPLYHAFGHLCERIGLV